MRAFRSRINLYFFHKHESFDGKGRSRRDKNSTILSPPQEVHEFGSSGSVSCVVREIHDVPIDSVHGESFGQRLSDAHAQDAWRERAKHSVSACETICVSHTRLCWPSGAGLRQRGELSDAHSFCIRACSNLSLFAFFIKDKTRYRYIIF